MFEWVRGDISVRGGVRCTLQRLSATNIVIKKNFDQSQRNYVFFALGKKDDDEASLAESTLC
jgi:hypothetical protein